MFPFYVCASPHEAAAGEQDCWHLTKDHEYQGTNGVAFPGSPAKSMKHQGVKIPSEIFSSPVRASEGQRLEALECLKLELESQSTEGCTPDQSTEGCLESPPYSPLGSPTPSLDVMLSSVIPTVRPLVSPKSSASSPFMPTLSPQSLEESVMMELMLDMIYRAKNAKKKGLVTRTLSLDPEELESMDSPSDSERINVSRTEKLRAIVKEMFRRMPASFARWKSVKNSD
eukprot:gnl/MRDRNA2_/MRDRNA2_19666_c0_seq1.p1 gnl/MRDRNA2_/MRDRNA2_19666_c0~~gnl/MRDRNA2_/MRDRNA2_19666_c0_seq1.p1  ORF type:complete len:228 (+),score=37.60 gnl/MRDRNA2_/MRDRNA2_19666_c0_seq1:110-793(+)